MGSNFLVPISQDLNESRSTKIPKNEHFLSAIPQTQETSSLALVPVPNPHPADSSLALVPVPNPHPDSSLALVPVSSLQVGKRKYRTRSSELVRVMDLKPEDEMHFRNMVRKTRMVYDSLRVLADPDLKAAETMRDRGLWINRAYRTVGNLPGIFIGDVFFSRMEMCVVGLHGHVQAGIDYLLSSHSSNREPIATSVIVSGGYNDHDRGEAIIYTGQGGHDQVEDQKPERGNLALERNWCYGVEVRVIRGFQYEGSPSGKVFVYDGLYMVTAAWCQVGRSGYKVYKYMLVRVENQVQMGSAVMKFASCVKKVIKCTIII